MNDLSRLPLLALRSARLLLPLALLSTPSCPSIPGCVSPSVDMRVELTSLATKTVPGALEADADLKDIKLTDRASFKPSKGATSGIDKRLRMKSTRPAGSACFLSEREVSGDVSARVRVAFDSTVGLVDGVSVGFLERRPMPPGDNPVQRVEAVYNAALDSFSARYLENGVQVGGSFDLPQHAHDVHLYLLDLGSSIAGQAAEATGEALTDIGANTTFGSHAQDGSDETALIAFGSSGLDKSGTLYFDQFVLDFNQAASAGQAEAPIAGALAAAFLKLDAAHTTLHAGGAIDVGNINQLVGGANLNVDSAESLLQTAITDLSLDPGTDPGAVHKSHWNALAALVSAGTKTTALLQDGVTSLDAAKLKAVTKLTDKARDAVRVALGQLNGFKGKSAKALDKALLFSFQ